jgi:hypothetical protein
MKSLLLHFPIQPPTSFTTPQLQIRPDSILELQFRQSTSSHILDRSFLDTHPTSLPEPTSGNNPPCLPNATPDSPNQASSSSSSGFCTPPCSSLSSTARSPRPSWCKPSPTSRQPRRPRSPSRLKTRTTLMLPSPSSALPNAMVELCASGLIRRTAASTSTAISDALRFCLLVRMAYISGTS